MEHGKTKKRMKGKFMRLREWACLCRMVSTNFSGSELLPMWRVRLLYGAMMGG